jgi:uncharacterized protein YbjT (DUF2867 family)
MENTQPGAATHLTGNGRVLVIGGNGKTGRRVAARLRERGISVRIGSRSGDPAFDWDDAGTWDAALEGIGKVYLTYYPDLAFPGVSELIARFASAAAMHGVISIPAGDALEPFIDADDIADVAVAALNEPGHDGQVYELSGPRLLGFGDVAREIAPQRAGTSCTAR